MKSPLRVAGPQVNGRYVVVETRDVCVMDTLVQTETDVRRDSRAQRVTPQVSGRYVKASCARHVGFGSFVRSVWTSLCAISSVVLLGACHQVSRPHVVTSHSRRSV